MPPWPQKKTKTVTVRLTERDHRRLEEIAKRLKVSVASYIRMMLRLG